MRRLFIIRKDLHLSSGKLAAMVGHCAEAYFTNLLRNGEISRIYYEDHSEDEIKVVIPSKIMDDYINNSFVKTICEARNLNHLLKAVSFAKDLGLTEDVDFGLINDKCLTELTPENEDVLKLRLMVNLIAAISKAWLVPTAASMALVP